MSERRGPRTRAQEIADNAGIVAAIIVREHGFVDHPFDRGGPTRWGVTEKPLIEWRRKTGGFVPRTKAEVREAIRTLDKEEATSIYLDLYVKRPGFDRIKRFALRELLVDSGVLHGRRRTVRWLQRAVGAKQDGVIGPITLGRVRHHEPTALFKKVLATRYFSLADLVKRKPSQVVFIRGWVNRANEFLMKL